MKLHIIIIIVLLCLFIIITYKTYEGFNIDYPEKFYTPSTDEAIPIALDGITSYMSPNSKGDCISGFQRDRNNDNSLCHSGCKPGYNFYHVDNKVYGCVQLNRDYLGNYSSNNYPLAEDKKTNIVSPNIDGSCPNYFDLDIKSGLCHSKCKNYTQRFYGKVGCIKLNTNYSQSKYNGGDKPYPTAEDGTTQFVSPNSSGKCSNNFVLDYIKGLCHTPCHYGKTFNGDNMGASIVGCV